MNSGKNQNYSFEKLSDCIKILSADAVEAAKSGHPGMPLGFSQVMTVLAFKFLKFNPNDPQWFNRDRLVLSAGHGSMLLYSFFYLAGYKGFSLDDIKNFRQLGSKTAGHPEIELFDAIETSTGPLGQGLGNAVGMAIAQKKYEDKLSSKICNYNIYAIVGDGCLMEGISYEAASIAGHLQLDNLIILFDDNGISIDGKTDLTVSEDHIKKFESLGFETFVASGYDDEDLSNVLSSAKKSNKPCFIACSTIIGKGANVKEGSEKSHGAPLGQEELEFLKAKIAKSSEAFNIDQDMKSLWETAWQKDESEYKIWQENFKNLSDDKKEYINMPSLKIPSNIEDIEDSEATRVSSGRVIESMLKSEEKLIVGSADLAGSNGLKNSACKQITRDDFSGNFIYYGVRENAMSAIMNGLAISGFVPLGGTFFVFSDYMRPSIRLSALMMLPVIYVMTHDSIGVGEDGPTHQPIEHLASFRAMPNINVFRPADFCEVRECYELALESKKRPSMMVLSRQSLPQLRQKEGNNLSSRGAYIISEASNINKIDVALFASGSEVSLAIDVQKVLEQDGLSIRVISVPCFELLESQDFEYKNSLTGNAKLSVAIEAASELGWHKIIGSDGLFFGMDSFGASAPAKDLFKHFGLNADSIASSILRNIRK
ncbi:MAG: transketolase [Pseudomonadota bacterium]